MSSDTTVRADAVPSATLAGGANPPRGLLASENKIRDIAHLLHEHPSGSTGSSTCLFTGLSTGTQDIDGDASYVLRQFFNNHSIGVSGKDAALFSAMGMTTALCSLTGAVAAKNAYDRYQGAKEIGYGVFSRQRVEQGVDLVRGVAQSMGGMAFIPYRPLSMTTSILGVSSGSFTAPTALGRVTCGLGAVGGLLFGVFYACIGGYFVSKVARLADFSIKMRMAGDSCNAEKTVSFLKDRIGVDAKGTLAEIEKAHKGDRDKVKQALKGAAIDSTSKFIQATYKEASKLKVDGSLSLSEKECRNKAEDLYAHFHKLPGEVQQELSRELASRLGVSKDTDLSFVELLGLDIKTSLRGKRNESELIEYIGGAATAALKKSLETGLMERLKAEDLVVKGKALEEAVAIINEAKSTMLCNGLVNFGLAVSGFVGTVASILSFIPAMANFAATGVLWLICAASMIPADAYGLYCSQHQDGPVGKYDKTLLYISTAVGAASLAVTVALGALCPMLTVPVVVACLIGFIWLANNGYSMHVLEEKERKYEMDHPTLAFFSKHVQQAVITAQATEKLELCQGVKKVAKKLTSAERKALKVEVARAKGFIDPSKRGFGQEGHRINLNKYSPIDLVNQQKELQQELEECLAQAPASTLRILTEMGLESLQPLSKALQIGDKDEALKIFRALDPKIKPLVDNKISLVYGFGELYFDQHTGDECVLRAVEKAFEGNRSSKGLSALYDYLFVMQQKGETKELLQKAKELFASLSCEEKSAVTLTIYNKRARKESSRQFAIAGLDQIQQAVKSLEDARKSELAPGGNLEHRLQLLA